MAAGTRNTNGGSAAAPTVGTRGERQSVRDAYDAKNNGGK